MHTALPIAYGKKLPVLSLLFTFLMLGWASVGWGQSLYWGGGGGSWNSSNWSSTGSAPYNIAWVAGRPAIFNISNSTITGATTSFSSINANENVTVSPGGTLSTGGTIATITVASGKTFDFGLQNISVSSGTGFIKNGAGVLALSAGGNYYPGGFTLNSGTVIIKGVAAFGSGTLTVSNGIIAANGNRDLTGKISSIVIGGDFTIGAITGLASSAANILFDAPTSLGNSAARIITIGGTGTYSLSGIISGTSSNLSVASTANGTLTLGAANTFSGIFSSSGATTNLSVNNALGSISALNISSTGLVETSILSLTDVINDAAPVTISGNGVLDVTGGSETIASLAGTSTTASAKIGDNGSTAGSFTIGGNVNSSFAGVISGSRATPSSIFTKQGAGIQTLTGANTYTGTTTVAAGTLQLNHTGGGTLASASNINISGGTFQVSTDQTINNLTLSSGTLTIDAGATLTINGTYGATGGTIVNNGTLIINGMNVSFPSSATVNNGSTNTLNNLQFGATGTITLTSSLTVAGSLTLASGAGTLDVGTNTLTLQGSLNRTAGNINASTGTVIFNGATTQIIPVSTFSGNVANLQILNTAGVTLNQSIAVTGALTVNGLLSPTQSVVISGAGTLTGTGTVQVTAVNHTTGDFAAQYTTNSKTLTNIEVEYAGNNTQYADGITYGFLKINNLSGVSLVGNATVNRTYKPNTGSLSTAGKKLTLVGTIASSNGTIDASTGEVIFGGTSTQTIPSGLFSGTIANLTISNNGGVTTSSAITTSSLTLNAGIFSIGSNSLTITAALSRTNGSLDASAGTLIFTNGIAISIPANTFTGSIQNLTINSSSSVAINSTLTIGGALTLTSGSLDINDQTLTLIGSVVNGSGDLKGSNKSNLILSGSTPIALNFNNSFNVLRNLTISTGANVTLGSALRITSDTATGAAGVLLVNGSLNTGGYKLTLKSSTSGTASVGTSTGTIIGDITVERQIPDNGHREWRLLTAPVTGTTIKASWQENANSGGTNDPNPGFGTLITGPGQGSSTTAAANGYDFWPAIANSSSSIRQYAGTPTSGSWISIPSIKNLDISTYPAYLLFVRGDRSIYAAGTNTNATILRATGTLKQGTQSFILYGSSVQGYTLVGNPYACTIDFDKILTRNATNLLPQFWRWDAQSGSYGGYTLVKKSGATYYTVPSPFTGNGTATTTQQYIESGQGFFVQPANGVTNNASFDIQETDKVTNTTTTSPFRIKPPVEARLFINLNQYYSADSIVLSDGVLASFVNTADTTQNVAKPFNFNENLGISRGTSILTVEAHKPVTSTDTVHLTLWNTSQRSYQLQLKAENWKTAVHAYLLDNYLKTSTPVNLKGNITTLNFAVDGTAASAAQDRFMVVFNTTAASPLIAGKLQADDADFGNSKALVTVYPNPVGKDRTIHLQLTNLATGNYHCSLYNGNGKLVLQTTITIAGSSSAHIRIPQAAAQGLYYLKIADANGKIIRQVPVTVID